MRCFVLNGVNETYWGTGGSGWTLSSPVNIISSSNYNAAGQLTAIGGGGGDVYGETRTYNSLMQLTNIVAPGMNVTYNYTAGQNNGRITSMSDAVTGESVTYQYDSLNRLQSATAAGTWGNSYTYDGWGNLLTKTVTLGSAPSYSATVDPSTNGSPGASGAPYTAPSYYNGGSPIDTNPYDVEGRKITDGFGTWYVYDPWGRRIWQETPSSTYNPNWTCKIVFYAVTGKRMENFNCQLDTSTSPPAMTITPDGSAVYRKRPTNPS